MSRNSYKDPSNSSSLGLEMSGLGVIKDGLENKFSCNARLVKKKGKEEKELTLKCHNVPPCYP